MRLTTFCMAALAMGAPTGVTAEAGAPFFTTPLPSVALAQVSGTASPYAPLTHGNLAKLVDAQTHTDFRQTASVGQMQMDIWWSTIGSELIANTVRGFAD